MDTKNPLFDHTATVENGAAVRADRSGGLAFVTPLTQQAQAWLHEHVGTEASWIGERLVVEMSFFPALADGLMQAGFTFERHALPN